LSGGEAVRLNDWLDGTRCAVDWQHDSAALKAQQCRGACGLRTKSKPLTTNATLRRTARSVKQEETRYANARKTRRPTKRSKDDNANQPETTRPAQLMQSPKGRHATQRQKDAVLTPNA
jgi:hypothetical protein